VVVSAGKLAGVRLNATNQVTVGGGGGGVGVGVVVVYIFGNGSM
jgi:hypothetical protein